MAQLSDDCFAFGGPMMSVDEAVGLIATRVTRIDEVETVALRAADGRILARDIAASLPLPPFTNSAVDGYAVRSGDLPKGAEAAFAVAGRVQAGQKHLVDFRHFLDRLVLANDLAAQGSVEVASIAAATCGIQYGCEVRSHRVGTDFPFLEQLFRLGRRAVVRSGLYAVCATLLLLQAARQPWENRQILRLLTSLDAGRLHEAPARKAPMT